MSPKRKVSRETYWTTSVNLTREQAIEYIRCRDSAAYMVEHYGHLKHIDRGKIRWRPYPWQQGLLDALQDGHSVVVLKSRQVGVSWTVAAFSAWLILFRPDIEILFLSKKQLDAIKLLKKCRFFLVNLPDFLRREFNTDSMTRISVVHRRSGTEIVSESGIDSLTTTGESGRGETARLIFLDELAHLPDGETTWTAIKPATSHGGQVIAASSPKGFENVFHRLWIQADSGESASFIPFRVHYTDCGLDQEWLDIASDGMTDEQIAQEFELAFIGTGSPAFNPIDLEACYIPLDQLPDELKAIAASSRTFATGVDSAEIRVEKSKRRRDENAITSLNEYGIQIAAEANKMPLNKWAGHTLRTDGGNIEVVGFVSEWHVQYPGTMYIEENGSGITVYNRHILPDDGVSEAILRRTTAKSKPRLVNQLKLALAGRQIIVTDKNTYYQLQTFEDLGNGRYEAAAGYKDDRVMALLEAWDALLRMGGMEFEFPVIEKQPWAETVHQEFDMMMEFTPGHEAVLSLDDFDPARVNIDELLDF